MADTKISALAAATLTEADEIAVNDGGTTKKATIAELRTAIGGVGFVMMDITSLREIASNDIQNLAAFGGILATNSDPALVRLNGATDKSLMVEWATSNVDEVQFPPVPMPPDLDETSDVTVHILIRMSGGTDALVTIDIQAWDGIGDTEMGGATGVITSTLAEHVITLGNADISGNPAGVLNIGLVPGGTLHTVDTIQLMGAWIEYTKKLPA